MRHLAFTTPHQGSVGYPNRIAFMYSRQPVVVQCDAPNDSTITAKVTCETNGGASYTETRKLHEGRAEFDISRIMQTLAPGPDSLTERLLQSGPSLGEVFSLEVQLAGTTILTEQNGIHALYGALDAGEEYGQKTTRRLFLNYPQTINMWEEPHGRFEFKLAGEWFTPEYVEGGASCREVDILETAYGIPLASLQNGWTVTGSTTWYSAIKDGEVTMQPLRAIVLVPDLAPRGCGAYLRWLNRRGEMSYWLFDKVQLETVSAVAETFQRYYEGDPVEPVDQIYRNAEKRTYDETRRQTISAARLTGEEFDDLCSLMTSPVVEMLDDTEDVWHRVNVEAGTQAKNNKRSTPKVYSFDAIITLPKRNVIRL